MFYTYDVCMVREKSRDDSDDGLDKTYGMVAQMVALMAMMMMADCRTAASTVPALVSCVQVPEDAGCSR